jgi:hypothetical protein
LWSRPEEHPAWALGWKSGTHRQQNNDKPIAFL